MSDLREIQLIPKQFKEDLIRLGIEGGKQAAATLRTTVLHYCKDIVDLSDETEVIASVYANYQGLSNAMLREGSVDDLEQLKNFLIGFTQAKASFDFVDVGHGKERADSKIKELMRWHLRNHNCKQILLGISHDAGYAPFLDEVVKQDARSRVAIIEGVYWLRRIICTILRASPDSQICECVKSSGTLPHLEFQMLCPEIC